MKPGKQKQKSKTTLAELLLTEQDDGSYDSPGYEGGYGVSLGGGGGYGSSSSGSDNGMWSRNGVFGAMGFAAIRDIWNILKRDSAKLGVQALSTVGSLFAGTVTMLLPFNSHLATSYVTRKFMYWEARAIKSINQQFEKELAGFDTGWELIKPDLIGLGFFIAPYGVVGNMMAAGQAIDTAVSITNVITGGLVGHLIDRIINLPDDMRDPGNLDSYIRSHLYRPFSYSTANYKERGLLGNIFHLANDEFHTPTHAMSQVMAEAAPSGVSSTSLKKNLETLKKVLGKTYQEDMQHFMDEIFKNTKDRELSFVKKNTETLLAPMFPAVKQDLRANAGPLQINDQEMARWSAELANKKNAILDSIMKKYKPIIAEDPNGVATAGEFKQVMSAAM